MNATQTAVLPQRGPITPRGSLVIISLAALFATAFFVVSSVGVSAVSSFYLAAHTTLGWGFGAGISGLGIAWVATRIEEGR